MKKVFMKTGLAWQCLESLSAKPANTISYQTGNEKPNELIFFFLVAR